MANKDVKLSYIEDDVKKVQIKTNLYLQSYGSGGTFHLAKEIIQNSFDELEDANSNGNKVTIMLDTLTNKLTVEDDGRGIPENDYSIEVVCTKLQSGSKFFRTQGGKSSGEFGVGLVVVLALSTYFSLATYRGNYMHKVVFENGVKTDDITEKLTNGKHGTVTEFIPNPKYLGKDCDMPVDVLKEWLNAIHYQVSNHVKFKLELWNGMTLEEKIKYKAEPFTNYINEVCKKPLFTPVTITGNRTLEENVTESILNKKNEVVTKSEVVSKQVDLDVAFTYDEHNDTIYDSFCNFTRTENGGVHEDAVEEALCRFLQNGTKNAMTENEKAKWDITWADVKEGLKLVINLSTDAQVQFLGNQKNKINNVDLKPLIKDIVTEKLNEMDTDSFKNIFKYIKMNARARIEANKTRQASKKHAMKKFDDADIDNYTGCNNRGKSYKEIFIVEGAKSAKGAVVNGRFSTYTQAVYGMRGCTKNPFKFSFDEIMANKEWNNFVKVLRCGIGPTFNINDLYFDKIIIFTDADVDGFFITLGICAFFVIYFPEIIQAGKLYKVFAPLYRIKDKNHEFVSSKSELAEIHLNTIRKKFKISTPELDKDELYDFLYDTLEYNEKIVDLQEYFKVDRHMIELIGSLLVELGVIRSENDYDDFNDILKDQKFVTSFMSEFQKEYPEITLKKNKLTGVSDGRICSIELNSRFVTKVRDFIPIWSKYGRKVTYHSKNGEEQTGSLSEFLDEAYKLLPGILTRYKGLGEMKPADIRRTVMNPDDRMLIRLTMEDCEKTLKVFNKLMGNKTLDKVARKEMMEIFRIDPSELDT